MQVGDTRGDTLGDTRGDTRSDTRGDTRGDTMQVTCQGAACASNLNRVMSWDISRSRCLSVL